ncbi:hypothetical protein [Streptomyces sp. NPDC052701]|uniref:hypothetical protein n=1 Tax=Streptomyces sp. NPDC052701 TaxID=3155533 RepID=UPI00343FFD04
MYGTENTEMYDVEETGTSGQASHSSTRTGNTSTRNPAADIEAVLNAVFGTTDREKKARENIAEEQFSADCPG